MHTLATSEEIVYKQTKPAGDKYQDDENNLLDGIATSDVPDLQSCLDSEDKTNEPNNC